MADAAVPTVGTPASDTAVDFTVALRRATQEAAQEIVREVTEAVDKALLEALSRPQTDRTNVTIRTKDLQQFLSTVLPDAQLESMKQSGNKAAASPNTNGAPVFVNENTQTAAPVSQGEASSNGQPTGNNASSNQQVSSAGTQLPTSSPNASVPNGTAFAQSQGNTVTPNAQPVPTPAQQTQAQQAQTQQSQAPSQPAQTEPQLRSATVQPQQTSNQQFSTPSAGAGFVSTPSPPASQSTLASPASNASSAPQASSAFVVNQPVADPKLGVPVSAGSAPKPIEYSELMPDARVSYTQRPETVQQPANGAKPATPFNSYGTEIASPVPTNNLASIMRTSVKDLFAAALIGKPVTASMTEVDPMRLANDHTGEQAKAFVMGREGESFRVVVLEQNWAPVVPGQAPMTPKTVQQALNLALTNAFDGRPPARAEVEQLRDGNLLISYHPFKDEAPAKVASLLNNAGFSLLAEPSKASSSLAGHPVGHNGRIEFDENGRPIQTDDAGRAVAAGGNANAANDQQASQFGGIAAMSEWLSTATKSRGFAFASIVAMAVAVLVSTFNPRAWQQSFVGVGLFIGVAFAFMLSTRGGTDAIRPRRRRRIRPAVKYVSSFIKGEPEPWEFFAYQHEHEQDWFESTARPEAQVSFNKMQPREREAFRALDIPVSATWGEVVSSFRSRARQWHPDLHPDADPATKAYMSEQFSHLMASYMVLRERYKQ